MASKGWTLGIIALASLAFLAVAVLVTATPALAVTGTPVPPDGNDWIIDQDTTVRLETVRITGDIIVEPGITLTVSSGVIEINASYDGEYGLVIDSNASHGNAKAIIDDSTIRSTSADNAWTFDVWGDLTVTNNAKFQSVWDGIWMYDTSVVDIDGMTLNAQGRYGIYVEYADPKVHNAQIFLDVPPGGTGTGVRLYGSSSDRATPDLDFLTIRVSSKENFEDTSGGYFYSYFYLYGFDCYYGEFDTLSNIDVSFEVMADGFFNTTSSPRWYVRMYLYGYYFGGGTILNNMDINVTDSDLFVNADTLASSGNLYLYNYFYGLRNYIGSDGSSPSTFTGLTIKNQVANYDLNNAFTYVRKYTDGRAFEWSPSSGSMTGDTITVERLHIENIEVGYFVSLPTSMNLVLRDNVFKDCYVDDYFHEIYYMDNDITYVNNEITNISMVRNALFRIYRGYGEKTFMNNNISDCTYYEMFYIYYAYGEVTIDDNLFMNNVPYSSTYAFFYIYRNYQTINMLDNLFVKNKFQYFIYNYYAYEDFDIKGNTWENNTGTNWAYYMRYMQTAGACDFSGNRMYNNTYNGHIYTYYNYNTWTIQDNHVEGNSFGSRGFIWVYDGRYADYDITDNTFVNNTCTKMFEMFGLGNSGTRRFTFERNVFIGNSASTSTNGGLLHLYKIRQSITVRDNEFYNNSASCIVFDTPYYYGYYTYPVENHWFYVEDNTFVNNSGMGIVFEQIDNCHIQIRGNYGTGNEDYVVHLSQKNDRQYIYGDSDHDYIYCYYNAQGPDDLIIEANNFSYNKGGAMYLKTSQTETQYQYVYYPYGNPDQVVSIKKNVLIGNGPDGWTLYLDYLFSKPSIKSNRIEEPYMGIHYGLAPDTQAKQFELEFREELWEIEYGGSTAYGFTNIDAVIYDSIFRGYKTTFYAKECELNVYWSEVPEDSGETEEGGEIYIWNHLEILVTWANATAVDSGFPVPGAVVAMQGANGDYLGAQLANDQGRLEPMVINPWTSKDGVMDSWSPYSTTVMFANVSTGHEVHVVGDFLAPNFMRLTINDIFVPEVIISNPQDDTLVNTSDVLGEGFLFELGSGIVTFEGRSDMMAEDEWEDITENVLWTHYFMGLDPGEHNLSVRAADLSGNWNTSTIRIIVDLIKPELYVRLEYHNATPIKWDPVRGGYHVRTKDIAINGTYDDNYDNMANDRLHMVIIRINGVPEIIWEHNLGKIYKRIVLDQGINTIIVDATDNAGNRNTTKMYIALDSYPPTIYVYSPLQNEETANETMLVTGLTEPLTKLEIVVQASAGTNTYQHMSEEDGTFMYPVDLFEGIQKILVTATDAAGNPTQVYRDVTLDTTPPDFVVNSPSQESIVTKEVRYEVIGTMTTTPDAVVTIGGQVVPHTGVFRRMVVLQEGLNVIEIVAVDKVGNEKVKHVYITRDTIPPVLEVSAPDTDDLITNNKIIQFSGAVLDSDGVVIIHKTVPRDAELLDGDWSEGTWKFTLELGDQDLEQDIEVRAFDVAGNTDSVIIHVRLDIVPPSLHIDDVPENVKTPFVWINGTTDENIPFVLVQGVPYSVTDGLFNIQWSLAAGENRISVEVTDEAGNEATDTVVTTYMYEPPPPPPRVEGDEGLDLFQVVGIGLILVIIVILVVVILVTRSRTRGR